MKKTEKQNTGKLKIIPLGGLEQIGMNITAFEYEDSIIVVDCGLSFPEDDMLGIDLVIPDITYLKENIDKVKGFFITHGHEDHIGAIPYVLKEINVPIYATKLTIGIIDRKLEEHGMLKTVKRKVVKYGQHINLGCFRVEFIKTNHSIQDAAALAIYSPAGIVVHTGDFKVDYTPVFGDAIDLARFGEIGKKGVLALMCDSTNAERPGFTVGLASIAGGVPPQAGRHPGDPVQEQFLHDADISRQLVNTRALAQVNANRYDAVLFVGGHGVMWDFPNNSVVNAVGRNIWERGGIVPWACGIGGYDVVGWQLSDCRQAGHRIHQRRRAKSRVLSVAAAGE